MYIKMKGIFMNEAFLTKYLQYEPTFDKLLPRVD